MSYSRTENALPLELLGRVVALAAVVFWTACNAIPQPVPIPSESYMRGTPGLIRAEVNLYGLPGAVFGAGRVTVAGPAQTVEVQSNEDGSFAATLKAAVGDQLRVTFEGSKPAFYLVKPPSGIFWSTEPSLSVDQPPSTGGQRSLWVKGEPGKEGVLAVNTNSGEVAFAPKPIAPNLYEISIGSQNGDRLLIYVEQEPLGEALEVIEK
jgi:hypothetical protein